MQQLDESILNFIQTNLHFPLFDWLMPWISWLGNNGGIWIVAALILMLFKKHRKTGILMLAALLFCLVIGNLSLKPFIARTRPFDAHPEVLLLTKAPTGFSFPSGHTMSSFAAATILFLNNRKCGSWALVLASLIAYSRLYLFFHYPSDIAAGLLIGIAIAFLTVYIAKVLIKKHKERRHSKETH